MFGGIWIWKRYWYQLNSQLEQTFRGICLLTCLGYMSIIRNLSGRVVRRLIPFVGPLVDSFRQLIPFTGWYPSSADTLRQLIPFVSVLVRNWIVELRSNKSKIQKQIKCGSVSDNLTVQCFAKCKSNFWIRKDTSLRVENCKYEAY